ncbi:scavenger receptor cysteine-rich type 1 protein M130-like [Strix uralensis]|uniref:scavenger receptor cysteine-rich type 1 protein M130-like n=1 Tax=Strix uralensis TaxID=36305 RepID=UPI003DA7169A
MRMGHTSMRPDPAPAPHGKEVKPGDFPAATRQASLASFTSPIWIPDPTGTVCTPLREGDRSIYWSSLRATVLGLGALLTQFMLVFEGAVEVRLADGGSRCAGRVEVKQQGQWGTVCGDYWDMTDAAVVCKQLSSMGRDMHAQQCTLAEAENLFPGWAPEQYILTVLLPCDTFYIPAVPQQLKTPVETRWASRATKGFLTPDPELRVGPIWDGELQCVGNESLLASCPKGSPKDQPCTHANSAVVTCTQYTGFRLVNGSTVCAGRVEVQVLGTWGTLCASRWDLSDAHVLCRQLNCGFAESIPGGEHFGRETGPVWRDSFHCDGTEAHLQQCPVTTLGASLCSQGNTAAVICSGSVSFGSVRLVGGGSRCDGRVEIFQDGAWGRVLDDQWDVQEASVVCRQLRCGEARTAYNPPKPERGTGPVGLRGVWCAGHEANLSLCNTSLPETTLAAGVVEDVGVICGGSRWLRLVNGAGRCAGRVEIYYQEFMDLRLENSDGCSGRLQVFYNGTWGSVCSNSMTLNTVMLVCKELGCGDGGSLERRQPSGRESGPAWLDRVQCGERNSSFWQCPSTPWNPQSCQDLREETNITCNGGRPEMPLAPLALCPNSTSCTAREKIRAVGGEDECSGRVEVWHRGSWGTVCDDSWDIQDAEVACRQLGCGRAVSALREAVFGMGMGPIWLEQVECQGTELSLQDCWARPGDSGACRHKEDAAVHCSATPRMATSPPQAGSRRAQEPFLEAVYEEIGYSPALEKQARFGHSAWGLWESIQVLGPREKLSPSQL